MPRCAILPCWDPDEVFGFSILLTAINNGMPPPTMSGPALRLETAIQPLCFDWELRRVWPQGLPARVGSSLTASLCVPDS